MKNILILALVAYLSGCAYPRPYGIPVQEISDRASVPLFYFYLEEGVDPGTFRVIDTELESAAYALIKEGDVLVAVEDEPVRGWEALNARAIQFIENRPYRFTFLRNGAEHQAGLVPDLMPVWNTTNGFLAVAAIERNGPGVQVQRTTIGKPPHMKLFPGDIVLAINGEQVRDMNDWQMIMNAVVPFADYSFRILRDQQERLINVQASAFERSSESPKRGTYYAPFLPVLPFDYEVQVNMNAETREAKVGEIVKLTATLLTRKSVLTPTVHDPASVGSKILEMEQIEENFKDGVKKTELNGRTFYQTDIVRFLFTPERSGDYRISPATFRIVVPEHKNYQYMLIVKSNPVDIHVAA